MTTQHDNRAQVLAPGRETDLPDPATASHVRRRKPRNWPIHVGRVALAVFVVGGWQLVTSVGWVDPFFVGQPSGIYAELVGWISDGSLFTNVWVTVYEALVGFAVSAVAGVTIGLILARNRLLDRITAPYISMLNALPRMALAPLFALWFGLGMTGKIALVVSVAIFNFLINTYSGAKSVDPEFVKMVRLLGATRRQVVTKVVIPSIISWVIAAMRFAVAYSLAAAVIAEIVGANQGLGYLLAYTSGVLNTNGEFAALLTLVLLAWAANAGVTRLERRLLRWREGSGEL